MKRIFFILLFSIILLSQPTYNVLAVCGCRCSPGICPGDSVFDAAVFSQKVLSYAKEAATFVEKHLTTIQVTATQINTYKTMWDQTVKRPLQDAMTLMTIAKNSEQILNLVNGSTGGDSLLVADPIGFVENKKINTLRAAYNNVEKSGGLYSESFLNNIVQTARTSVDTPSLSQSSIPTIIQNNICDDAELSQLAMEEVSAGGTEEYTEAEYKEEKAYWNEMLCVGNPKEDKQLAETLLALDKERPTSGKDPWGGWLAMTGGDNEYNRKIQKEIATQKKVEAKMATALQDMNNGGGIRSATICVAYDDKGVCTKEEVINPSKAISEAFSEAKLAGLNTAMKALGTGGDGGSFISDISGILSLAGEAYNAIGQVSGSISEIVGGITGAIGSVEGTMNQLGGQMDALTGTVIGGGIGDSVLNTRRTAVKPTNTSSVVAKPPSQNLLSDPERKATLILPIQRILGDHLRSVDNLVKVDNDYISEINHYKSLVEGIRSCYAGVETYARTYASSTPYANYSTPQSVLDFYAHEMKVSNDLIAVLNEEINTMVPNAKNVIQNTLNSVNASNSSEEITSLTDTYHNTVDGGGLPTITSIGRREGDYQIYKSDIETKTNIQGSITTHNNACTSADTAVKNAIIERDRPAYNYYGG